ncbi:putative PKS/NRPS-like protein biosynthetic cluster [Aspergillus melleus]|uniref:PKS/NRPS-like protein biosynthetic cluster n=1 Tax=Aspergillus melleus TaxID=138277 RepID=A0ACC3B4L2_9EURO|nr:putative PKS/NRPS-like protein biosynthetic cluster [Aspergillus melleus]
MDVHGVALVLGAGSGIGRTVAYTLASQGLNTLVCADIDLPGARETAESSGKVASREGYKADAYHVDVRQEEQVKKLVGKVKSQYGRIDICVTTAGTPAANQTPISDMSLEAYRSMDEVHNIGCFLVLREVLRAMADQEPVPTRRTHTRGSIVLVTSLASEGAFLGVGNYIAAKHAVRGLVQTAALENAKEGIRVNAVAPSYVSGPMMDQFLEQAPAVKAVMLGDLPMRRLADPEEVADAVVFLASQAASYINGHTLVVDGGSSLQLSNQPFT